MIGNLFTTSNENGSFTKAFGISEDVKALKKDISSINETFASFLNQNEKNNLLLIDQIGFKFDKSISELKKEIISDVDQKMAENNTDLIYLIAQESSKNENDQKAKCESLFKNAKNLNIPMQKEKNNSFILPSSSSHSNLKQYHHK